MNDYDIRKAIAGGGNTIYEADKLLTGSDGVTDYEVLKTLASGNSKFECTLNYARSLGLDGNYQTRYEVDKAIYEMNDLPIEYYKLNPDISTDEEFNSLPWGRHINTIELPTSWENNVWYTFAVPFDCKRTDFVLGQDKLSICELLRTKGNVDEGGGYDSILISDNGVIKANHPYQVYNCSGEKIEKLIANGVEFTSQRMKTNRISIDDNFWFIANYLRNTYGVGETKHYAYNNGSQIVWVPDTGMEIKAYSGIFESKNYVEE